MSFLNLKNKTFLITGISNKKSVATHTAKLLKEFGANLILSVQNEDQKSFCKKTFPNDPCYLCDVTQTESIVNLKKKINSKIDGILHSVAFARFSAETFHETSFEHFTEAMRASAYSLVELSNQLKDLLHENASVVTVSISNLRATSYGYMGPIKAMLNSMVDYLAKSFSEFSQIRFNAVAAGPLKTSASAGIPNYLANYFYSEQLTLRKKNLDTKEVANTIAFLLSEVSSGINATTLTVDAGMNVNYFDQNVVENTFKHLT